jgi:hypothetical protein
MSYFQLMVYSIIPHLVKFSNVVTARNPLDLSGWYVQQKIEKEIFLSTIGGDENS